MATDANKILARINELKLLSKDTLQQEKAENAANLKVKERELKDIEEQMKEVFEPEELKDLDTLKETLCDEAETLLNKLKGEN